MQKTIYRKILVSILLIALFISFVTLVSFANQEYPSKPVTIIVPFNPGGSTDRAARTLQEYLKEALGAPAVVVENLPGAGGLMGTIEFLKREADGYTLLFIDGGGLVLKKFTMEDVPYDIQDLSAVIGVFSDPRTLFVQKESPYSNVEDLVVDIRKNPYTISLGYVSGSTGHWFSIWLKNTLDLPVNVVGYSGGSPATTALIGGHIDAYLDAGQGRVGFRDEIKAIGVAYPEKTKNWPEAMPLAEQDIFEGVYIPGEEFANNGAIFVKKEVREEYPERFYKLVSAFYELSKNEDFKKKADEIGLTNTVSWWPPSKYDALMANAFKMMESEPEILAEIMQ